MPAFKKNSSDGLSLNRQLTKKYEKKKKIAQHRLVNADSERRTGFVFGGGAKSDVMTRSKPQAVANAQ